MSWLKSLMEKEAEEPKDPIGIVVVGNIQPDMHSTIKESIRKELKKARFKTVDMGKGVHPQLFVNKLKETNAKILAISVNTIPAKNNLKKLDDAMNAADLKNKVTIIIGGAAVKKEDAEKIGALFGETIEKGVALAKEIVEKKANRF